MRIGAHVGGIRTAVERALERECEAFQVFAQSPRQWKPTAFKEEEFAKFRADVAEHDLGPVLIHAIYLINCATEDAEMCRKSLDSLVASLEVGAAIGAAGVVLHAGSALIGGEAAPTVGRAGAIIREALERTDGCDLHLENTAGTGGTLGRSFEELHDLMEAAGGGERIGFCLDSCHLLASGYDVTSAEGVAGVVDEFDRIVGLDRLRSLHVNDSQTPLGSNRDRHAPLGEGEMGADGCAAFLSEPRFDALPTIFEGPGVGGKEVQLEDIRIMRRLREQGLAAR
jgi:deoxyribonuclease IV